MNSDFPDDDAPVLTAEYVLDAWRRRRWIAITVAVATVAAAYVVISSLPNLYRSSATVLVERAVSEEFVKASVTAGLETRIQSIQQFVISREHLSQMIDTLGLYPEERRSVPLVDLVGRMRGDITLQLKGVEQTTGGMTTYAFTVGYTGRDPRTVANVVNDLVAVYTAENESTRQREASTTAEFLRQQLDEVRRALDAQDRQTRAYSMAHTSELPQQLATNLATLERLHGELSLNNDQQLRLTDQRQRIEQEASVAPIIVPLVDSASPETRLAALKQQLAQLRRSFSTEYPDVRRVTAEIQSLEADIAARAPAASSQSVRIVDPETRRNAELRDIDANMRVLKQREIELRQRTAGLETLVGSTPRRQLELDQLSRGRDSLGQQYQQLLTQYDGARQAAALEQGHGMETFRLLDPALPPRAPIAPDRRTLLYMAIGLAMMLGAASIVAAEKLDSSVHTPTDLGAVVPTDVVVSLRQIGTRRTRRRAFVRGAFAAVGAVVVVATAVASADYVLGGSEWIVRMLMRGGA